MELSFIRSTFKQGSLLGIGFCIYTMLMWATKLDSTYLIIGQYINMVTAVFPLIIILWAIRQENDSGGVSIIDRIGIAVFVGLISFTIYEPFLFVYHHFINPNWFDFVLNLKENELRASEASQEYIIDVLMSMKKLNLSQSGLFQPSAAIVSVIVIPMISALLSLIFIKTKRVVSPRIELGSKV